MKVLLAAAMIQSCTSMNTPIVRTEACQEQATAWCQATDPHATGTGCQIIYQHWCGMGGTVQPADQDACMLAISDLPPSPPITGYAVPLSCQRTWAVPPSM